jgi:hypothetical protein
MKFVQQIEKYPELELDSYKLKSYFRKIITEKSRSEIATVVKLTG